MIAVVVAVVVFGGDEVVDTATGLIGGLIGGTELIDDGTGQILVKTSDQSRIADCTAAEVIQQKQCDNLRIVIIDATKDALHRSRNP